MHYSITFTSSLDEPSLRAHLERILLFGPFALTRCEAIGPSVWELEFAPRAAHIAVKFAKFAELQVLLARCGAILALDRTDTRAIA